jgi:predicted kinase
MQPTLFIMLGYPGAGKTTTAKLLHELTGATHLWEDKIRLEKFPQLTVISEGDSSFPAQQNNELHHYLNELTGSLLAEGTSVIYDTSFNRYEDRERMYHIAEQNGANVALLWVQVDKAIARERATKNTAKQETRILASALGDMDTQTFERLSNKLEAPHDDESPIVIDGLHVSLETIRKTLSNAGILS